MFLQPTCGCCCRCYRCHQELLVFESNNIFKSQAIDHHTTLFSSTLFHMYQPVHAYVCVRPIWQDKYFRSWWHIFFTAYQREMHGIWEEEWKRREGERESLSSFGNSCNRIDYCLCLCLSFFSPSNNIHFVIHCGSFCCFFLVAVATLLSSSMLILCTHANNRYKIYCLRKRLYFF